MQKQIHDGDNDGRGRDFNPQFTRFSLERHHLALFIALLLAASIPYYYSLANPFTDDDWMFLHVYRGRSPLALFSPRVLWFYRPLQAALFAGFYRVAGLNPVPYNLASLALYFGGCAAWYGLLRRLLQSTAPALLASFFLLVNWQFCDTIFWKSNYGGLLAWLGAVGVLHAAVSEARGGSWRTRAAAALAFIFALLSKESAVNIPFLAALVYLFERRAQRAAAPGAALREAALRLAPLFAILGAYLIFHWACVRDIETVDVKGYVFVAPGRAALQYLFALNHLFFFFGQSPLLPQLNPVFQFITGRLLFLPLLLWAGALWSRDRLMLLGLLFTSAALVPQILLKDFHAARFYLVPATGMGLVWAGLIQLLIKNFKLHARYPGWAIVTALLALAALRSEAQLSATVRADRYNAGVMGRFAAHLAAHRAELPPDVCLVFSGLDGLTEGLGLRQMAKIVLQSERAEAFKDGTRLSAEYVRLLNGQYPHKMLIWMEQGGQVRTKELGNVQLNRTQ